MHKFLCYIAQTSNYIQDSFCGDPVHKLRLMVYCDASFADCSQTSKSTSGAFIAVVGPNTFVPITAICKKQTCVSHSSTESEIVALELALRAEALALLTLWDTATSVLGDEQSIHGATGAPSQKRERVQGGIGPFSEGPQTF